MNHLFLPCTIIFIFILGDFLKLCLYSWLALLLSFLRYKQRKTLHVKIYFSPTVPVSPEFMNENLQCYYVTSFVIIIIVSDRVWLCSRLTFVMMMIIAFTNIAPVACFLPGFSSCCSFKHYIKVESDVERKFFTSCRKDYLCQITSDRNIWVGRWRRECRT